MMMMRQLSVWFLQLVHVPQSYSRQVLIGLAHARLHALPVWLDLHVPHHFIDLHTRCWSYESVCPMLSLGSACLMSPWVL